MIQQKIPRATRDISIEKALEWAFGAEKAQLDPSTTERIRVPRHLGYGSMERALMEIAALGVRIDTSRSGATFVGAEAVHWDADAIAAVVAGVLDRRTAEMVVAYAKAGTRPNWRPGAEPKIEPRDQDPNGKPRTEKASPLHWLGGAWRRWMEEARRSKKTAARAPCLFTPHEMTEESRKHLGMVTPIAYRPSSAEIDNARAHYLAWWTALHTVREHLIAGNTLRSHSLTKELPPAMPWQGDGTNPIVETGTKPDWRNG